MYYIKETFNIKKVLFITLLLYIFLALSVEAKISLTSEEEKFIAESESLKAVSIYGSAPLININSKGQVVGIGVSFLDEVSNLTGLSFEYKLYKSVEEIHQSDYSLIVNATPNYVPKKMLLSNPYLRSETIIFINSSINPNQLENKVFASVAGGTLPEGIKEENTIYFNNREETLDAVNKGIADYGYGNAYSVAFYTLQNDYDNLVTIPTGMEEREYSIGLQEDNEILLSIINKCIDEMGEGRIQTLILDVASHVERKITLSMILSTYWKQIFTLIFLVVSTLSFSIYLYIRANKQLKFEMAEIKEKEKEIRYLSYHDKLTGLHNRAYFENKLKLLDRKEYLPISIIIGDINGLKITNDVFGHHEGDKLLQNAAKVLIDSCRSSDIVARFGGDEFIILLPNTSNISALEICKRIDENCRKRCSKVVPASISLGYATKEVIEVDIQEIIKDAEDMMYSHKLLEGKSARSSIIYSLEASLYEKDIETKEHGLRIVETTAKLGKKLGLSQREIDDLNLFARLHDIGKIAIPERILNKKGKLTKEEFEEIKKHPEAGYRIAESSQILSGIADYILTHHERWDGTGYPQGLKGDEIPLLSRILSIADAYDAMTNDRPYRKAMDKELAIEELERCSGKQFDPKLVPLFISLLYFGFPPKKSTSK